MKLLSRIIGVIFLLLFFYFGEGYLTEDCEVYFNYEVERAFKNIVVEKYLDSNNHNIMTTVLSDGTKNEITTWDYTYADFYNDVTIGDSILKKSGESVVKLKTTTSSKDYVIDFGCDD